MSNKRIMILGGAPGYSGCVNAAKAAGYEVVVVDRNPEAFCRDLTDLFFPVDFSDGEATLKVAREASVDAVIPMNDYGVPTASYIAEKMGLVGIPGRSAEIAVSKPLMRQRWEKTGTPSVRYRVAATLDETIRAVEDLDTWPLIVKPCNSSGGGSRGVSRIDEAGDIERAYAFAANSYRDGAVIVEEYIEGTEHSVELLFAGGEAMVASVGDNIKLPPPFRVNKDIRYPSSLSGDAYEAVCMTAVQAATDIGIGVGAVHVEVCMTKDGPKLFELGARCGGGGIPDPIVSYVTGTSYFKRVIESYLGVLDQEPFNQDRGCVYRFLCPPQGTVSSVSGMEDIRRWEGILKCGLMVKPGQCMGEIRTGLDRGGYIIAAGKNRDAALELADRAENHIKFEYGESS